MHERGMFPARVSRPAVDVMIACLSEALQGEAVRLAAPHPPAIPFFSNVSGTWITNAEAQEPAYWGRHIRQPVRFSDAIAELVTEPDRLLLEVGPGNTLSGLVRIATTGEIIHVDGGYHAIGA